MRYRPDLDGVRAVAVLAVFAAHSGYPWTGGGWMGVDVFFVLSGYLITTLLVGEYRRAGRIRLGHFYLRRVLRLYPALVLMLVISAVFYRDLGDEGTFVGYLRAVAVSVAYVEDLVFGLAGHPSGGFGHTWSLGVEEQFYLLWPPLVAVLLARGRDPFRWACAGTVLSFAILALQTAPSPDGVPATYYLPWTRFAPILAGCALAFALDRRRVPALLTRRDTGFAVVVGLGCLVLVADRAPRFPNIVWESPAVALLTVALVANLDVGPSLLRRSLGARPLAMLGRRSYGFYLYYEPVIIVVSAHSHYSRSVTVPAELILTLALCAASYQCVELPFLRRKSAFDPAGVG